MGIAIRDACLCANQYDHQVQDCKFEFIVLDMTDVFVKGCLPRGARAADKRCMLNSPHSRSLTHGIREVAMLTMRHGTRYYAETPKSHVRHGTRFYAETPMPHEVGPRTRTNAETPGSVKATGEVSSDTQHK